MSGDNGAEVRVVKPVDTIPAVGATVQLALDGRNGPLRAGAPVRWATLAPEIASVDSAGLVTGLAPGLASIAISAGESRLLGLVRVAPGPAPQAISITPPALMPVLGPLIPRSAGAQEPVRSYDSRFVEFDLFTYNAWLQMVRDPDRAGDAPSTGNHSGALRGRLAWAIRSGEAYGKDATNPERSAYARGREMIRSYLSWSKANNWLGPGHNNTGISDVVAYYVLEGDAEALDHICVTAAFALDTRWGNWYALKEAGEPRGPAMALAAFSAADRLGIPYGPCPARPGDTGYLLNLNPTIRSWKAAGTQQVGWIAAAIGADGALLSPAHYGNYDVAQEVFFMNAWLAQELLLWFGYTDPENTQAFDLARRLVDRMIDEFRRRGGSSLPYLSAGPAFEQVPAPDLAGYHVWPALVLWQETGDPKYREFALAHLRATHQAGITGIKQFNQVYSYLGHGADALLKGARWR